MCALLSDPSSSTCRITPITFWWTPQLNWAASAAFPLAPEGPVDQEDLSPAKSSSTWRAGDQLAPDAAATSNGITGGEACCRMPLYGPQNSAQAATLQDVEHASRNPLEGWPSREDVSLGSYSVWRTKNPAVNITFGNIPSPRTSAPAMNGASTVALVARGATKASIRDFRALDGARELEPTTADT